MYPDAHVHHGFLQQLQAVTDKAPNTTQNIGDVLMEMSGGVPPSLVIVTGWSSSHEMACSPPAPPRTHPLSLSTLPILIACCPEYYQPPMAKFVGFVFCQLGHAGHGTILQHMCWHCMHDISSPVLTLQLVRIRNSGPYAKQLCTKKADQSFPIRYNFKIGMFCPVSFLWNAW